MTCILIVDDDRLVRETMKALFRTRGYDVEVADSGKAGIEAVKARSFDLAIVDLFMPGMDGLTAITAIRQIRADMPLIAASGFMFGGECPQMPNFDSMAAEAGATSTLYKPFRPDVVLKTVASALATAA